MNTNLLTADGFPRADLDVAQSTILTSKTVWSLGGAMS